MRILSICKWSAIAGTLVFATGCLEQSQGTNSKKPSSNTHAKGFIQKDSAGQLVLGAPQGNAITPKTTKFVAPAATLSVHIRQTHNGLEPSHVRGARIYDDFTIELAGAAGVTIPTAAAMNPLWDLGTFAKAPPGMTQANMPMAGPGVFTCSGCHGFDYEGGLFTWNAGATNNLLELRDVRGKTEEDVIIVLFNGFNIFDGTKVVNVHNYTSMLTPQAMVDVADFVVNEIIDTHQFIRAPSSESLDTTMSGEALYKQVAQPGEIPPVIRVDGNNFSCIGCHGADGKGAATSPKAKAVDLPMLAWKDPFKFLHRTLFGKPRSLNDFPGFTTSPDVMSGFYETILTDGLHFGGPEQGAATLLYIQTMTPAAP